MAREMGIPTGPIIKWIKLAKNFCFLFAQILNVVGVSNVLKVMGRNI